MWEQRLTNFIAEVYHKPYKWGYHDCLLFCGGIQNAVQGKDQRKAHRGKYKSKASAYRHLKDLGFDSPEEFLDAQFPVGLVGYAQRGDLVMAEDGIPGVCMGSFALSVGQEGNMQGLVRIPRDQWVKVWTL